MNSANKTKTTWNIINENINKRHENQDIPSINLKRKAGIGPKGYYQCR